MSTRSNSTPFLTLKKRKEDKGGCELCGGSGEIPVSPLDPESVDPYAGKVRTFTSGK